MPDELDDVAVPDELDELEDLDDLEDEADADDEDDDLESVDQLEETEEEDDEPAVETDTLVRPEHEAEDEDEDEPDDEDVEASLDVILKERLVVEDEPEDEELTDGDDRSEISERVLPKQPDEFVCRSCFLVKHPSQLADPVNMLCRDCV